MLNRLVAIGSVALLAVAFTCAVVGFGHALGLTSCTVGLSADEPVKFLACVPALIAAEAGIKHLLFFAPLLIGAAVIAVSAVQSELF